MSIASAGTANPKPRHAGELDKWQVAVEWAIAGVNVLALLAGLVLCLGVQDEGRIWLAAILVLFGPGSGLVQLIGAFDTTVRCVLVVGLSVATSTLVAQLLLTVHSIGVLQAAIPLTIITGLGLLLRLIRLVNREPKQDEEDLDD